MPVPYVSEKSASRIAEMERKLLRLSSGAGILFISVTGVPEEMGDCKVFFVRLGLVKSLTKDAGDQMVRTALADEIANGAILQTAIYLGIRGAAGDESHEGAGPAPS